MIDWYLLCMAFQSVCLLIGAVLFVCIHRKMFLTYTEASLQMQTSEDLMDVDPLTGKILGRVFISGKILYDNDGVVLALSTPDRANPAHVTAVLNALAVSIPRFSQTHKPRKDEELSFGEGEI